MNGVDVNIGTAAENTAAIDTGTTLIGAPTTAVTSIWSSIPGAQPLTGQMSGFWEFRTYFHAPLFSLCVGDLIPSYHNTACNANLNVSMSFGGPSWPISAADMSIGTNPDGSCVGAIFDLQLGSAINGPTPSWIVGDTFLVRFICRRPHLTHPDTATRLFFPSNKRRKTCTPSFKPTRPQSALHHSRQQLVVH